MPKRRRHRRHRKAYVALSNRALYHLETILMMVVIVEAYLYLAQA